MSLFTWLRIGDRVRRTTSLNVADLSAESQLAGAIKLFRTDDIADKNCGHFPSGRQRQVSSIALCVSYLFMAPPSFYTDWSNAEHGYYRIVSQFRLVNTASTRFGYPSKNRRHF